MAALPPLRARVRRLLLATVGAAAAGTAVGYLVAAWPAPEPVRAPFDHDTAIYAVYAAAPMLHQDPRCILFLDEWMRRPNWELTITRGRTDICGGDDGGSRYRGREFLRLDSAGNATWWSRGGERHTLHLPPTLLQRLHRAAAASCGDPDRDLDDDGFVRLHWGGTTEAPGPLILAGSDAFTELMAIVDAARDLHD